MKKFFLITFVVFLIVTCVMSLAFLLKSDMSLYQYLNGVLYVVYCAIFGVVLSAIAIVAGFVRPR